MLTSVTVRDFAIIDRVALELGRGLTVLTGETGAGKSILVDALGLVLGDRADASAIRHGAERAEITATLDLEALPRLADWLAEQALDADGDCVLRRVVSREGRSRAWINGAPVALQTLRALAERVVDIHGQHEHQSLARPGVQRGILDQRITSPAVLDDVAGAWQDWKAAAAEAERLEAARRDREQRLDLLRYQLRELDALAPEAGEAEALAREQSRLGNVGRLAEAAGGALELVYEGDRTTARDAVARAAELLAEAADLDPALAEAQRMLAEAEIQISEAAADLRRYTSGLEVDPERLDAVSNRLQSLKELARKHQVDMDVLPERLEELRAEVDELEQAEERLEVAASRLADAEKRYGRAADALSAARSEAGDALSAQVSALMQQLGMPGGRFQVSVEPDPGGAPSPHGLDRVEFRVTANPGQPPGPLGKVASGGELARISLALQVAAKTANPVPVMIFDEVDSGVGGGVAEIVGRRLRELGETAQVLCVTHLPQVASQADHHLRVTKLTDGDTTRTRLNLLTEEEKVEELARMLGGVEITSTTRSHAEEMRRRAREG
ncbi:MAG: DNA repair protein RecN [Gammaproteobacteria bacterium]